MTERDMPTYTRGDTVHLPLEVRDESGIGYCFAHFYLEEQLDDPEWANMDLPLELEYDGEGRDGDLIELTTTVAGEAPDIYRCRTIIMRDSVGNQTEIEEFNTPILLRIEEDPDADNDGPELMSIRPLTS